MSKLTEKAKQELERLRQEERAISEHLVEVLADVVHASADAKDEAEGGAQDICVSGSEQFADYRNQLLPWSECEPKVVAYCQQLQLPATAEGFVQHLRTWLTEVATEVDRTRPENRDLMINEKGEPSLKKLKAKAPPAGLAHLEETLHEKIPERHLLDVVVRIERLTGFGRHLGPLSGNEPKRDDAWERQLLAIFAYGTNLGPHQMARHLRGTLDADQIAHINRRHFTVEKLDAALRDVINCFNRYTLPHYWGMRNGPLLMEPSMSWQRRIF